MIELLMLVGIYVAFQAIARSRGRKHPAYGSLGVATYMIGMIILWMMPFPEDLDFNFITILSDRRAFARFLFVVLFVLVGAGILACLPMRHTRAPPSHSSGLVWRVLAFIVGVPGFILVSVGTTTHGSMLGTSWGFVLLGVARILTTMAARVSHPSPEKLLASDRRPPVLFLRPFTEDARIHYTTAEAEKQVGWALFWAAKTPVSFEWKLSRHISQHIGPFIALGNPEDDLPHVGAARLYISDADWQAKFRRFAEMSACTLVIPGMAPGLLDELQWLRTNCKPQTVYLVIPPTGCLLSDDRGRFMVAMNGVGIHICDLPEQGAVLAFDDHWCSQVLAHNLVEGADYILAIHYRLRGFVKAAPVLVPPSAAKPSVPTKWWKGWEGVAWALVTVMSCIVIWLVCKSYVQTHARSAQHRVRNDAQHETRTQPIPPWSLKPVWPTVTAGGMPSSEEYHVDQINSELWLLGDESADPSDRRTRAIARWNYKFRQCWRRAKDPHQFVSTLKIRVRTTGRVARATPTAAEDHVGTCIAKVIRTKVKFPRSNQKNQEFLYTFMRDD